MPQDEKLINIVVEGDELSDMRLFLKNGMGIREIYQGDEKLYERKCSYVYIELDSTLGA